ncbi:MAG: FmdB family zinc ribbon protein [Pseudomonadota bacterium]
MPAYEYSCTACPEREVRITGIDDHTVICDQCGQVMVRQMDVDTLLASYSRSADQAESTT